MKMFKKVLAGMMAATLLVASVMGVSAADSKKAEVYESGISEGYYDIAEGAAEFANLKAADPAMYDLVTGFNAKTKTQAEMLAGADAVQNAIKGKTLIYKIFDLIPVNGGKVNAEGKHEVELTVTSLTKNATDIVLIHYDEVNKKWETIKPVVDYDKQTITAVYNTLSPVGIYANVSSGSTQGPTSAQTVGTSSAWMLWLAVAVVALGAGVVVSQKKNRQ